MIQRLDTIPELVIRLCQRSRRSLNTFKRGIIDAALLELQGNTKVVEGDKCPIRDICRKSKARM